ncbi:Fpg/Nei family DNA glycosylase [Paenibacillus guangzhouensis]|uniref:Fpg/Nei family DNA glycosylase n=1 Tax=Paenibacillus guangzhouensis TaxID=1473112 RepID=UPI001266A6BA|nr:DNA-formamidopyrimidine glycosylase family protein [Paenibacillus guangzhouensis]
MLELPELETYKKLLSEQIINKRITGVQVKEDKLINSDTAAWSKQLQGREVLFIERRGKQLLFHLDNGKRLLLNLGAAGQIQLNGLEVDEGSHANAQVMISFGDQALRLLGIRQGYIHLLSAKEADQELSNLGPELLDRKMNLEKFQTLFARKRGMLKSALVNQSFIAGLGNGYADEIAFEAALLPSAKLQDLSEESIERLYHSTMTVLHDAIEYGGMGEERLNAKDDLTGGYKSHVRVIERDGQACERCGATIQKAEVGSRKTYYCASCQKEK